MNKSMQKMKASDAIAMRHPQLPETFKKLKALSLWSKIVISCQCDVCGNTMTGDVEVYQDIDSDFTVCTTCYNPGVDYANKEPRENTYNTTIIVVPEK